MPERDDVRETRQSYDLVAANYHELVRGLIDDLPFERSALRTFAELVQASGTGTRVLDVGCGPGHVSARLRALGLDPTGIDLSPGMIEVARASYPEISFRVGSMEHLGEPAQHEAAQHEPAQAEPPESASGILAYYSFIHIPPDQRSRVLDNFARVLSPGGVLLMAFQVGDEARRIESAYGHQVALTAYRLDPMSIVALAVASGLRLLASVVTSPATNQKTDQAFLFFERPSA